MSEMRHHPTAARLRLKGSAYKANANQVYNAYNQTPAASQRLRTVPGPSRATTQIQLLLSRQAEPPPDDLNSSSPGFEPHPHKRGTQRTRLKVVARMVIDLLLLTLTFVIAYHLRYTLRFGAEIPEENQVPLSAYFGSMAGFVAIFFVLLQFKGFYRLSRTVTLIDELGLLASAAAYTVLAMIAIIFVLRPLEISRLMYLYLFPISIVLLGLKRAGVRRVQRSLLRRGIGVRNVMVVGATDPANRIMKAVIDNPNLGLRLIGYVDNEKRFSEWTMPIYYRNGQPVPHMGRLDQLGSLADEYQVDEVIVALPATMHEDINEVINLSYEHDLKFSLVPDVFELQVNTLDFQELNGVPLIGIKDNRLTGWNYLVKRASDIVLALIGITLAAIPMLVIAIAIRLDSPGPIILRQTRIGKYGRRFTCFKFRSMYIDADARFDELKQFNQTGGATFKMVDDPRRTRIGRFIRRNSLDELPQLFNILLGQMSLIGPRPGLERELEQYAEWHFRRLEVTPGLTGLSQVSGRSNLKFDETVRLDIYYAENWSLWVDFKILLRTLPAVLKRDGAY